jgi:hypothetical protein
MSLVNLFGVTLKDVLPLRAAEGMLITDTEHGTITTVTGPLFAKMKAYADHNRISVYTVVHQLRDEIHRTSAPEHPPENPTSRNSGISPPR